MDTPDFLRLFMFPGSRLGIASGNFRNLKLYDSPPDIFLSTDTYFTPAQRKPGTDGHAKETVAGSLALWVDIDTDTKLPQPTLPPSTIVHSGHGYHVYWLLEAALLDIEQIEHLNKLLEADIPTADVGCWNVNRVLRVPGTPNTEPPPALAKIVLPPCAYRYKPGDIAVLESLPKAARQRIRTGGSRGFKSRSERDWSVIRALVRAGASDDLILHLYKNHAIGDKMEEAHETYLPRTIGKIRESTGKDTTAKGPAQITEADDGYIVVSGNQAKRISTFTIAPKVFLDGGGGEVDAIVGTVQSSDGIWENVTFTREAFTTVRSFDKQAPVASWQFLGSDADIRRLLPMLLDTLREDDAPRVSAVRQLGLHFIGDQAYFIGDRETLTHDTLWQGYTGPTAWLPNQREHPSLDLTIREPDRAALRELIPALNVPETIWPMIGWYAASPLKPWLEEQGYRFPILHVTGPRGSGKTTLIQRVFLPLFGQVDPKSYDSGTTRFVSLALLGSTNAVPIAFSEFRYDSVERFLRFVLLAYDTGHDPRGRADQTTVDYPLSAPFSLDGEDKISDPAALHRLIIVHLGSSTIEEGSPYYQTRASMTPELLSSFAGQYVQDLLGKMHRGELKAVLETARSYVFRAFPKGLPDRIRNNLVTTYFGILLWCDNVQMASPDAKVLTETLKLVHPQTGRGRMLADDMIEDAINAAAQGSNAFFWRYEDGIFWFQTATTHSWWIEQRRRRGRAALERDSLMAQYKEMEYITGPKSLDNYLVHGVRLSEAREFGLDIPTEINTREVRFNL